MANSTELIGVLYCGLIAAKNKWMFRVQPIDDVGIDAHMEFVDSSGTPQQGQVGLKRRKTVILFFVVLMKDNIIIGL